MGKTEESVVSSKGQLVIPKGIRDTLGFDPGTRVMIQPVDGGVVLVPIPVDPLKAMIHLGNRLRLGDTHKSIVEHRKKEHR